MVVTASTHCALLDVERATAGRGLQRCLISRVERPRAKSWSRSSGVPVIRCAATSISAAAMSATAQRDELWAQIEATAYPLDNTLPVSDPNAITGLGLLIPPFLWQTFFHKGSTMPIAHNRTIHGHGAVAKVAFKASSKRYTGLFASGGIGLARFSLGAQAGNFKPGLAVKIFVEGNKPSVNFIAMHSRDGQDDRNFFGEAFTNILPPAVKPGSFFLTASFAGAIATMPVLSAMDKPESAVVLPLREAAQVTASGEEIKDPKVPYQVIFTPEKATTAAYEPAKAKDMRVALAQTIPAGTVLYKVSIRELSDSAAEEIGTLVTEGPMVASKFGDESLFFKHMRLR